MKQGRRLWTKGGGGLRRYIDYRNETGCSTGIREQHPPPEALLAMLSLKRGASVVSSKPHVALAARLLTASSGIIIP